MADDRCDCCGSPLVFGQEVEDLRWLVGHLLVHNAPGNKVFFPPRLDPLLTVCQDSYDPGRFTLANVTPGGTSSVTEAPPPRCMVPVHERLEGVADRALAELARLKAVSLSGHTTIEAPHPRVLTALEEEIVRSAADWLEQDDLPKAEQARLAGLLMIIDSRCPQGAVRLDEAPQATTEAPPAPTDDETLKLLRKAIYDPGRFCDREPHTDGEPDELHVWQAKACLTALRSIADPSPAGTTEAEDG